MAERETGRACMPPVDLRFIIRKDHSSKSIPPLASGVASIAYALRSNRSATLPF
jgi:hypothetical protein